MGKRRWERTVGLLASALADGTLLLQVDVPALGLTSLVLEGEGKDGAALLDGVLAVGLASREGRADLVEGSGGGELVYFKGLDFHVLFLITSPMGMCHSC